jgi:simple sugar transport system ATP-binding protein
LCDRATILRGGKVVAECDPAAESARSMAQLMIGAEVRTLARRDAYAGGKARLVVERLDLPAEEAHGVDLRNVGFEVRAGEILGIAGVAGNGQNELLLALSGERTVPRAETVRVDGAPCGPARRRAAA